MTDGKFSSVNRPKELLDLVDDEWLADTLSDDGLCANEAKADFPAPCRH